MSDRDVERDHRSTTSGERDLTTTRQQVFGDVECGTECRICGRNVTDGRSKTCSDYCNNLLSAVMGMLNWTTVRRRVIERDNQKCQKCGYDRAKERLASAHMRDIIDEEAGEKPDGPGILEVAEADDADWDAYFEKKEEWRERREEARARYGKPGEHARRLEVDHIERITDGGHPFDPGNLQTLCEECHKDKTARENSEQRQTPSRGDMSRSLFEYVADGGGQ